MLLIKFIGTVLVTVAGWKFGEKICVSEKKKLEQTEGFLLLIRFIMSQIDAYMLPIHKIFDVCDEKILRQCGADKKVRDFSDLLENCEMCLDEQSLHLLESFGNELGKGDRISQIELCDRYAQMFSDRYKKLDGEYSKRCRVIMTLCMCCAAGLCVLLF